MIKAWAVCAMLVAVSHVALGYPHPFWGQSNGNIYSTFGPTVGPSGQWKPVGSLSSYERLYSENLHTLQSVSPVVSSSGTVFFAVPSCEVGDCPTTPPQVHGLRGPLVGLAAVAANGTELWRTSYVPLLLNRQSLSLGPNQQYLLVSGSQKGLMVFNVDTGKRVFSSSEDYMYSAPAQTFVLGLNTMFGCSEFGGGMQSIIFNVDDDFGFTNSLAWSNPKVGNGTSCRGRPVMDAHSGEYIMALEGCNIVAYHQGDGTRQPMFSAVEDLEFPVAGSTISCSPQLMVNPVTSALVVTGTYHPPASSGRAAGSFVVARYMSSRVVAFTTAGGTVASAAVTSDGAILFASGYGFGTAGNTPIQVQRLATNGSLVYSAVSPCQSCSIGQVSLLNDDTLACGMTNPENGGIAVFNTHTGNMVNFLIDPYFQGLSRDDIASAHNHAVPVPGAGGSIISPFGWTAFVPPCGASSSANGEQCNFAGTCVDSQCVCAAGYTGANCSACASGSVQLADGRCQQCPGGSAAPCSNNGVCAAVGGNATCSCNAGFHGADCSLCPAGHTGPGCNSTCLGYNATDGSMCNNRGSCDQSVRGSPVCNCQLGFAGIGCAECAFGFTGEQCDQCLPDFVGPRCQLCPGSNGNGTVCDNRGSCEMGANGPTCSCDFPYATDENGSCNACFGNRIGATCDRCHDWQYGYDCSPCPGSYPDSGTVCNGNGQCDGVGTTGGSGECECEHGWVGDGCGLSCPGGEYDPCNGNGVCSAFGGSATCTCDDGWVGDDCGLACPSNMDGITCGGNGQCIAEDGTATCLCNDNYGGVACSECQSGYSGADCESNCPGTRDSVCNGHGSCFEGSCNCDSGYVGEACDAACPGNYGYEVCNGQGSCYSSGYEEASCDCNTGYVGVACGLECPGMSLYDTPCNGQGSCYADGGAAYCTCNSAYTGVACGDYVGTDDDDNGDDDDATGSLLVIMLSVGGGVTFVMCLSAGIAALCFKSRRRARNTAAASGNAALLANPPSGGAAPVGVPVGQPVRTNSQSELPPPYYALPANANANANATANANPMAASQYRPQPPAGGAVMASVVPARGAAAYAPPPATATATATATAGRNPYAPAAGGAYPSQQAYPAAAGAYAAPAYATQGRGAEPPMSAQKSRGYY